MEVVVVMLNEMDSAVEQLAVVLAEAVAMREDV